MKVKKSDLNQVCELLNALDGASLERQELMDKAWELERKAIEMRKEIRILLHCNGK